MTSPSETLSYCCLCDAPPGKCHHTHNRYLDDITYERDPRGHGWNVPPHERERFDLEPLHPDPPKPAQALDLVDLVQQLEQVLWLDPPLTLELENAYERNSTQTTLAVKACLTSINAGKITNPAGLIRTKLRLIR